MNAAKHMAEAEVRLRWARPADCELVWEWNFATDVRLVSKRTQPITFTEHARWYAARIMGDNPPIWIIERARSPVGVVRLDWIADLGTRISIAIAARARGRGVGRLAITAACETWWRPIVAEIYADNLASRACFEACGFVHQPGHDTLLTYHWKPETR